MSSFLNRKRNKIFPLRLCLCSLNINVNNTNVMQIQLPQQLYSGSSYLHSKMLYTKLGKISFLNITYKDLLLQYYVCNIYYIKILQQLMSIIRNSYNKEEKFKILHLLR